MCQFPQPTIPIDTYPINSAMLPPQVQMSYAPQPIEVAYGVPPTTGIYPQQLPTMSPSVGMAVPNVPTTQSQLKAFNQYDYEQEEHHSGRGRGSSGRGRHNGAERGRQRGRGH